MKKINLKKLVLASLTTGIAVVQTEANAGQNSWFGNQGYMADATETNLTQSGLEQQLNPETQKIFQNLSPEGKELALKLANQSCKGKNDCKGLNSCKSAENACAGLGGCKGRGKGPFTDKNMAVMVAAKQMMGKRLKAMGGGS